MSRKLLIALSLALSFTAAPAPNMRAQALAGVSAPGNADVRHPLTTVAQIRALTPAQITAGYPVEIHAVLTYYEPIEGQIFAQDETGGIFIVPPSQPPPLHPGDAVMIRGSTVPSFAANVRATEIQFERHARFPQPLPVTWREILAKKNDCRYVSVRGIVRSATLEASIGKYALNGVRQREGAPAMSAPHPGDPDDTQPYVLMDLQTDGGSVRVHMQQMGDVKPFELLDSEVELEGTAGGLFDGKFQQIGAEVWVSTAQHMKILKLRAGNPVDLPLTAIDRIESQSWDSDRSQRVHIRGSITLYEPGLQLVIETPERQAVQVNTYEQAPLRLGQVVDVVGFPNPHEYSEVVGQANVVPTPEVRTVEPVAVDWNDALAGHDPFELMSMEGKLAAEVHERHQDTLIIEVGAHVLSAILPRTVWNQDFDQVTLPEYKIGSRVRVTGVCFVHAGGPWNTERWFDLEMRNPNDVAVLADPTWWTVRHLLYVVAALLALMVTAFVSAVLLHGKVRRQRDQIRLSMEAEAARERRVAHLESERVRVLEAINSMRGMDEVLLMILDLMSAQLQGRSCWCELANGTRVGKVPLDSDDNLLVRRDIYSGAGEKLGALLVTGADLYHGHGGEVMEIGASLAALAIDNRRLYETLVHRSQYDQLTNAANRFLLESRLDEALAHAGRSGGRCALIYIDLDEFKKVNDLYGHRSGDLYLQQVSQRFSGSLRGLDTLARVGGDEFIALVPVVRSAREVEEIVQRLGRCFDEPFQIDAWQIKGTASIGYAIYPEDGLTKDELKKVADSAMYAQKTMAAAH